MGSTRGNVFLLITGSELTDGHIQDSNGPFLAERLRHDDFRIIGNAILPDEQAILSGFIKHWTQQPDLDLLIMTGGLGPTEDDLTVDLLARLFQKDIALHQPTIHQLKAKFQDNYHERMERQARFLQGSHLLLNDAGCAPGFLLPYFDQCDPENATGRRPRYLAALPGVPFEMEKMVIRQLQPLLQKILAKKKRKIHRETIILMRVAEAKIESEFFKKLAPARKFQYGICAARGALTIRLISSHSSEISDLHQKIKEQYLEHYCPADPKHALVQLLVESKRTVAIAESCTGGMLAAELTAMHGASGYFRGSITAYHNSIKKDILSVTPLTLKLEGAVSKETAAVMATEIRKKFQADIGISTTGWAGATSKEIGGNGKEDAEAGRFFIAISLAKAIQSNSVSESLVSDSANESANESPLIFIYEGCRALERKPFNQMVTNLAFFLAYFILRNGRLPRI